MVKAKKSKEDIEAIEVPESTDVGIGEDTVFDKVFPPKTESKTKEDYFSTTVFPKVTDVQITYLSAYKEGMAAKGPIIVVEDVKTKEDILKDLQENQTRLEVDAMACNPIGDNRMRLGYTAESFNLAVAEPIPIDKGLCARLIAINRNYVRKPRRRSRLYMRCTFEVERCALALKNVRKNEERSRNKIRG